MQEVTTVKSPTDVPDANELLRACAPGEASQALLLDVALTRANRAFMAGLDKWQAHVDVAASANFPYVILGGSRTCAGVLIAFARDAATALDFLPVANARMRQISPRTVWLIHASGDIREHAMRILAQLETTKGTT